ncbi:MAG: dihydrodipicolinate synthase family protein [Saccharofermentanales bacterium]|jgi:dihydrodipicolinate synthase/N-acetylneuraminate lyase|nr:dihydrodipicolinate synthase family protein [Spirochaetota bacterium]
MHDHQEALKILGQGTVIPATPLALDGARKFDEKTQRLLMRYYLACGVGGIATAVHSTQFAIRDPEIQLFEPVISLVIDEIERFEVANTTCIVRVCGVCGPIEQALQEAKLAKSLGYDAVLLSPGGLNHLSEETLIERTKHVASIIPVIGFYLQTAVGGRVFSYDYWQQLCEIPNLVAIKCASFNRYTTLDVVRAVANSSRCHQIALYTGNDDNIVHDLLDVFSFETPYGLRSVRFTGGLLGHWCIWTKIAVKLHEKLINAVNEGHIDASVFHLAAAVTDMNAAVFDPQHAFKGCIPGIHEVLRRQGIFKNRYCLDVHEDLSPGQSEELDRVITSYPQLIDDDFITEHLPIWKIDL